MKKATATVFPFLHCLRAGQGPGARCPAVVPPTQAGASGCAAPFLGLSLVRTYCIPRTVGMGARRAEFQQERNPLAHMGHPPTPTITSMNGDPADLCLDP